VFGDVALHEDSGHLGIEPDCEQRGRQFESVLAHDARAVSHGQGVQIDDAVEGVALVLAAHPVAKGPEVIAEMNRAGGLDAREDTSHPVEVSGVVTGRPGGYGGAD